MLIVETLLQVLQLKRLQAEGFKDRQSKSKERYIVDYLYGSLHRAVFRVLFEAEDRGFC